MADYTTFIRKCRDLGGSLRECQQIWVRRHGRVRLSQRWLENELGAVRVESQGQV